MAVYISDAEKVPLLQKNITVLYCYDTRKAYCKKTLGRKISFLIKLRQNNNNNNSVLESTEASEWLFLIVLWIWIRIPSTTPAPTWQPRWHAELGDDFVDRPVWLDTESQSSAQSWTWASSWFPSAPRGIGAPYSCQIQIAPSWKKKVRRNVIRDIRCVRIWATRHK